MPNGLWITDIVCAALFALDFLFRGIYLSSRRRDYMLSWQGLVTIAVVLPVLPTSFFLRYQLSIPVDCWVTSY